ncbi:MAG: epoxyqueuosine reductase [Deltaproteobacteria bacterium]|nr:epoxyqueuosine reductase [Candidatus Zymogenaceae bacterium]
MEKEEIRQYGLSIGADVVGFAAASDYKSERTQPLDTYLPGVKSIVVLGYRGNRGALESASHRIALTSRMGEIELGNNNSYRMARFIEKGTKTKAAPVPVSYPLDMAPPVMGMAGDVSLRHAAVAAGLGAFGRNNLVLNPEFGSQIVFAGILTQLPFASDPPVTDNPCTDCGLCVENCPAGALEREGYTDTLKCLKTSQPYGFIGTLKYFSKFVGASPDEQKALLRDPALLSIYQAQFIGFQYHCFSCIASCPVGSGE